MNLRKDYITLVPGLSLVLCFYFLSLADRTEFLHVLSIYAAAFAAYLVLVFRKWGNFWFLLATGLLARLVFWDSLPAFSQDFYRFVWDGMLWNEGYSAYSGVPAELYQTAGKLPGFASELYEGMGSLSRKHHSNYPPLNQLFFWLATVGMDSITEAVVRMRVLIILADLGTFYLMRQLMRSLQIPPVYAFLYFLNPLLILECTGNLHFESVVVFFCIAGFYFLKQGRFARSGVMTGAGILTKLLPLIILPAWLNFKKWTPNLKIFGAVAGSLIAGMVVPFLFFEDVSVDGFLESVLLWFGTFEFNASLYYVVRAIGWEWVGYNIIQVAAPVLAVISALLIFAKAIHTAIYKDSVRDLLRGVMWMLVIYLAFATTVHPWYLILPLAFSVFTGYRFMILWTAVVFLSYFAYSQPEYAENLHLIAVEYLAVAGFIIYERRFKKPRLDHL